MPEATAARIIVAAGLVAGILGACAEDQLSRAEFATRARDICTQANEELQDLEVPFKPADFGSFLKGAQRIANEAVGDLRRLEPPEADAGDINTMIEHMEITANSLEEIRDAVRDRDLEAARRIQRETRQVVQEARRIATKYGLTGCVEGPGQAGEPEK